MYILFRVYCPLTSSAFKGHVRLGKVGKSSTVVTVVMLSFALLYIHVHVHVYICTCTYMYMFIPV